jgi:elongation factor Ts
MLEQVKELRAKTGAGMMDCKRALEEACGDTAKAEDILRIAGHTRLKSSAGRDSNEGGIGSYVHHDRKVAAMVEVSCETDFAARSEVFERLLKDLSMHIAASKPKYLDIASVPEEEAQRERSIFEQQAQGPIRIQQGIIEGKMKKFYSTICLLEQPFVMDGKKKVQDIVAETALAVRENVKVRGFSYRVLGEEPVNA